MIYESFEMSDEEKACRPDQTQGSRLLVLALATSIDALAVGLSLGVVRDRILYPAAVIGATSFALTSPGPSSGRSSAASRPTGRAPRRAHPDRDRREDPGRAPGPY